MIAPVNGDNSNTEPEGWAVVPLIEAVTLQRGFDLPVQDRAKGTVPIYASNGRVGTHNISRVKGPGVVTGRSGTIGKVQFVEADFWPLNTSLYVRDFHGNDPQFVALLLKTLELERYLAGTGVPTLNRNIVHEVVVTIPPFKEQQRIAAKVKSLSDCAEVARNHLSRVPLILKRFRQAVLAAACSGRLTEDWRSSKSQQTSPVTTCSVISGFFDESDLPELPAKWAWTTIGALAAPEKNSITDGPFGSNLKTEHYTTIGPRVIRLQNIGDYRFVDVEAHISTQHFDSLTKHQIRAGDVAIACLGDPVPRACVIPESVGPAIAKADCVRFKPNPEIVHKNYVCYVLNDSLTRARMSEIVHGVGRARLNLQQIKSIPVPLPPMVEQLEVVRRVESMLHLAGDIERRVALATERNENLAQSILAKAFRGELVPTEAELARREGREYEAASALLERIRAERASQVKTSIIKRNARRASVHV